MRRPLFLLSLLLFLAAADAKAQAELQRQQLQERAQTLTAEWEERRAEIESFAQTTGLPVRQHLLDGRALEIVAIEKGRPIYNITHNWDAARTSSVDAVQPGGALNLDLTGAPHPLGIWDAGAVRETHQELSGRVVQRGSAPGLSNHATHVAGTMIASGVDGDAQGMSVGSTLDAYYWTNDIAEMSEAAAEGLPVSNHSYGRIMGWFCTAGSDFVCDIDDDAQWRWYGNPKISETEDYSLGFYGEEAAEWDGIVHDAPQYVIVKSAGNNRLLGPANQPTEHEVWDPDSSAWVTSETVRDLDGGPDGYQSLGRRATAKNILTVGAVEGTRGDHASASDVEMTGFSSWGPTDDGRVKPDLVAEGTNVYSSLAFSDGAYGALTGTSMAAPVTSGTVSLLQEHYQELHGRKPLASSIRALLIHTADPAGSGPEPDYKFGWGLLNAEQAASVMTRDAATDSPHLQEIALQNGETFERDITASGSEPLVATIAWTDPAGESPDPQPNPDDRMLVNDLDLRVEGPDGTHEPFVLDPANPNASATRGDNDRDNVEQVFLANPTEGTHTLSVSHKGQLDGGEQTFSLVTTGQTAEVPILTRSPDELEFGTVATGTSVAASVTVEHVSGEDVPSTTGTASVADSGAAPFQIAGGDAYEIGEGGDAHFELEAGESLDLSVEYAPESASPADEGRLTVDYDGASLSDGPLEVDLTGEAEAPQVAISPDTLDGTARSGNPLELSYTIGNEASDVAVLEVDVADHPDFLELADWEAGAGAVASEDGRELTLDPQASATLTWAFEETVTETTDFTGTITHATNDPGTGDADVAVEVTVEAAQIAVEPDSIDFGTVAIEGARDFEEDDARTETFTIENKNQRLHTVSTIEVLEEGAPFVVDTPKLPIELAEGETINVTATYDPTEAPSESTTDEATVAIESNADSAEHLLEVALEGEAEAPAVAFAPDDDFALEAEPGEEVTFTQTITNDAEAAALSVEEIALPTAEAAPFEGEAFLTVGADTADVDPEAGFDLEPGASKDLIFTFEGAEVETTTEVAGELTYATNATDVTFGVTIDIAVQGLTIAGAAYYPTLEDREINEGRALEDATVTAISNEDTLTVKTSEDGSYVFDGLPSGTYTIEANVDRDIENVSVTDAFRVIQGVVGTEPFADDLQEQVADVTASGQVRASDALQIARLDVGLTSTLDAGDWFTSSRVVELENGAEESVRVFAAEYGDATLSGGQTDGDEPTLAATTAAPQTQASADGAGAPSSKATAPPEADATFEVPVRVGQDAELGAFEVALRYDADRADFQEATAPNATSGDVLTRAEGGTVRLSWLDETGGERPAELKAGSELATLTFAATSQAHEGNRFALDLDGGELVAPDGTPARGVVLELEELIFSEAPPSEVAVEGPYPNPASEEASLALDLPGDAEVRVAAYNTLGQRVERLREQMAAGKGQILPLDASNLPSGQYLLRVTVELDGKTHQHTHPLTVVR